jgi:hypothetical protein
LTASVCVGAFVLAEAGLLDGVPATTNRNAYDSFEKAHPKVKLVRGVRFVENEAIATATGLTASTSPFGSRSDFAAVLWHRKWPTMKSGRGPLGRTRRPDPTNRLRLGIVIASFIWSHVVPPEPGHRTR